MKRATLLVLVVSVLAIGSSAFSQQPLINMVAEGCSTELKSYCEDVTLGEGRVLACLYAHNDKLSGKCEYALFDAAAQLQRAVAALVFVVNECSDDLKTHCSNVVGGDGRYLDCLQANEEKVSDRCKNAFKEVAKK